MTPAQEKCAHTWTYIGVRFRDGTYSNPGGSARTRYYGQATMCVKCALVRVERLRNNDSDTFQPIMFNATPATPEEFPIEQEKGSNG